MQFQEISFKNGMYFAGVFQNNEYFDVYVEYAQTEESHLFCRVTAINQSSQNKSLFVVPQVWFRLDIFPFIL